MENQKKNQQDGNGDMDRMMVMPTTLYPFRTYGTKRVNLIRETFG